MKSDARDEVMTYRVSMLSHQIIGTVCMLFFAGCSIGAWLAGQYPPIIIFASFILMGAYLVANTGSIGISDETIFHRNFFGHFRMAWSDVEYVEQGYHGSIVLYGKEKRFAVVPALFWSGKQVLEATRLFEEKMKIFEIRRCFSADYKIHYNVRTHSSTQGSMNDDT